MWSWRLGSGYVWVLVNWFSNPSTQGSAMGSSQSSSFSHIHHLCSKMTWLTSFLSYLNYLFTFTQTGHWRGHAQGRLVSAPSDLLFWIIFGLNSIVIWNAHLFITIHSHCFYTIHSKVAVSFRCLSVMSHLNVWEQVHSTFWMKRIFSSCRI